MSRDIYYFAGSGVNKSRRTIQLTEGPGWQLHDAHVKPYDCNIYCIVEKEAGSSGPDIDEASHPAIGI